MAENKNSINLLKEKLNELLSKFDEEMKEAEIEAEEEEVEEEEKEEKADKTSELEKAIKLVEDNGYVVGVPEDNVNPEDIAKEILQEKGYVIKKKEEEAQEDELRKEISLIKSELEKLKETAGAVKKSVSESENKEEQELNKGEVLEKLFDMVKKGEIAPEVIALYEATNFLPENIKRRVK